MPLDYKRSYKSKVKRRRIITAVIIVTVCLLAAFSVLYLRYWSKGESWNPVDMLQGLRENMNGDDSASTGDSEGVDSMGKRGMALERQPLHLYTIGTARVSLADVNREYVLAEEPVDDSYFDDALFIGDSRTEGFMMYSSLTNIHAYCSKGLNISRIYTDAIVPLEDGRTVTVMEALQVLEYKKIYIMFGVNELGWPYDDLFQEQYSKLVQDVKKLQPDAIIYVQNIIPISASRSATDNIYNNANVSRFNSMIETICEEQNVIYLDVASALADETGALPENASTDGIHCNAEYCDKWLEYLKANTYELESK